MTLVGSGSGRRIPPPFRPVVAAVTGNRSAQAAVLDDSPPRNPVVDWALYRDGVRLPVGDYREAVRLSQQGGFVWIGLHEPDAEALEGIAADFDLHPLAVEDAVQAHQRPKLERYEDMLFLVLKTVRYLPHESVEEASQIVETGEVMVFLGEHFVITVRHGDHGGLRSVRRRLEAEPELLALGPSAVLHAVADHIVDSYVEVSELLQDDLDEIEGRVFSDRRTREIERIYLVKREVLELRRSVSPLAAPLRTLAERNLPLVDDEIREYFRDVEDHLTRARDQIASYEELLSSILQASLAQLSVAENEDMRKITAWAAIFAVPTAIAGIYGMNFRFMPEITWEYGYPSVLLMIFLICVGLYLNFKRQHWL